MDLISKRIAATLQIRNHECPGQLIRVHWIVQFRASVTTAICGSCAVLMAYRKKLTEIRRQEPV